MTVYMYAYVRICVKIPDFSAKLPDFSAKLPDFSAKQESAHIGPLYSRRGVYSSAVEGAMTRPVHVRVLEDATVYLVTAA